MEEGVVAPLSFPTTYECYQFCSQSGLPLPWYFRMRTFSYGATECSCVGGTCSAAPIGGSSSTGRKLHYIRDLQTDGTITSTTIYRAEEPPPPTTQPTMAPTAQPSMVPTAQPSETPTLQPTMAPTAQPSVAPTLQPTMAPTAQPTPAQPLPLLDDGPNQPMLNIRQLTLGFHSFLGLLPHEQQGVYMRRSSKHGNTDILIEHVPCKI
jgi:hypothetical protein